MEDILGKKDDGDKIGWQDQKDEIEYINNPSYKDQHTKEVSKVD